MGLVALTKQSPSTGPETSVAEAVHIMVEANVGSVAILEGKRVVGVFTERDLMRRVVQEGKDPATTTLRDVMTSPVFTVTDGMSVSESAAIMRRHHIRHLPVLDENGDFAGMLGLRYLLYGILDDLERKVGDLTTWLMDDSLGG